MPKLKIVLFGSSGLVGSQVQQQIAQHERLSAAQLLCPSRKVGPQMIDFSSDLALGELLSGAQSLIWCLGTTLKKAGSRSAFEEVDLNLPARVFALARRAEVSRVFLVSSEGASQSSLFFYSRIKGELESKLQELRFFESVVYRPSLLIGKRSEPRRLESLAQSVLPRLPWGHITLAMTAAKNVQPIDASKVAASIVRDLAGDAVPGHRIVRSGEMQVI
jgi:uncharacterized protein YbjT (DUF2867 family)